MQIYFVYLLFLLFKKYYGGIIYKTVSFSAERIEVEMAEIKEEKKKVCKNCKGEFPLADILSNGCTCTFCGSKIPLNAAEKTEAQTQMRNRLALHQQNDKKKKSGGGSPLSPKKDKKEERTNQALKVEHIPTADERIAKEEAELNKNNMDKVIKEQNQSRVDQWADFLGLDMDDEKEEKDIREERLHEEPDVQEEVGFGFGEPETVSIDGKTVNTETGEIIGEESEGADDEYDLDTEDDGNDDYGDDILDSLVPIGSEPTFDSEIEGEPDYDTDFTDDDSYDYEENNEEVIDNTETEKENITTEDNEDDDEDTFDFSAYLASTETSNNESEDNEAYNEDDNEYEEEFSEEYDETEGLDELDEDDIEVDYQNATDLIDALTGFRNQKSFSIDIDGLDTSDLAVVAIDVNELATTNEIFGRDAGDILLRVIAAVISEAFGEDCYRISDDDFIALLSGWDESDIVEAISGIEEKLEKASSADKRGMSYSAAFGYAISEENQSVTDLMNIADEKMHDSKSTYQMISSARKKANIFNKGRAITEEERQQLLAENLKSKKKASSGAERIKQRELSKEKLETDQEFNFNDDGFYDDAEPLEAPDSDGIQMKNVVKAVVIIGLLAAFAIFVIYWR